jgi:hypothetical protein
MKYYFDNCCFNRPYDDQTQEKIHLEDALGPIGMTRFMQQYDTGYGDYTKEKYEFPDMAMEEIDNALKSVE